MHRATISGLSEQTLRAKGGAAAEPAHTTRNPMEAAVIVPTLNENGNIGRLLDGIMAADPRLHAIIVDDGSTDGTDATVRARMDAATAEASRIHLIERHRKMGYASAVQDGMRYALQRHCPLILQMDADFSHDPGYLPALLAKSADCDLVMGSRYIKGGGTRNWGIDRKILSGTANWLARTLLGLPVRDCTGGFRCWRADLIQRAGVLEPKIEGYAFLFVTLELCHRAGARFGEVPIVFVERQHGKSKMSRRIIFEAVRTLFALWFRRLKD